MFLKRVLPLLIVFSQAGFSASTITLNVKACIDGQSLLIIRGNTLQWHNLQYEAPGTHPACPKGSEPTFLSTTSDGVPDLTNFVWTPSWPDGTSFNKFSAVFTALSPTLTPPPPGLETDVSLSAIKAREHLTIDQLPTQANDYTLILDFDDSFSGGPDLYEAAVTITTGTAAPMFTLRPGTYAWTMKIAITDGTPDAVIYYTLDGSTPTAESTTYTAPIQVTWDATIKAIAVSASGGASSVTTGGYAIDRPMEPPAFSLPSGTYAAPQTITLSDNPSYCSHAICLIYYTLNGSTPTTGSTKYTGPIMLGTAGMTTIKAIAASHHFVPSRVASATYTIE